MNKIKKNILPLILVFSMLLGVSLAGCSKENFNENNKVTIKFDFSKGTEGWTGNFADLPVNYEKEIYELEFKNDDVPVGGEKDKGLMIQGHNRSDDLFMFIARDLTKKDGLKPDTKYSVKLSFDMATNVAPGLMGIGGAPGESVFVKAGIINREPKVETKNDMFEVNFDKGQQATGGKEATLLGHVAKENSEDESYQYKHFEKTYEIITNSNGEAWIIIGTDSGFEGLTKLYYTNIQVVFEKK